MSTKKLQYRKISPFRNQSMAACQDWNESRRSDGQLPYRILRFPSSKSALWNHDISGSSESIHMFSNRTLQANIEKDIIKLGTDLTQTKDKFSSPFTCQFCGKIVVLQDGLTILFNFDKANYPTSNEPNKFIGIADISAPVNFSIKQLSTEDNYCSYDVKDVMEWLLRSSQQKEAIAYRRFMFWKSWCQVEKRDQKVVSTLHFRVLTLATTFLLNPISQVTIIPTALSKGLADPIGNAFLHGEPKSGYVTMDDTRRILLVLDSDPKVVSLPLVGIWISGINLVQHPFTWACLMRYVHNIVIQERICYPPDPFLLLIYEKPIYTPKFYDCFIEMSPDQDSIVTYAASISVPIAPFDDVEKGSVRVLLERIPQTPCTSNKKHDESQDMNDDLLTPRQKLSFTPFQGRTDLDRGSLTNMVPTNARPDDQRLSSSVPRISPKQSLNDTRHVQIRHNGRANPAIVPKHIPHDKCSCNDVCAIGTESNIRQFSNEMAKNDSPDRHDVYDLLMAQEQQLKELKMQLDSIMRERQQIVVPNSSGTTINNGTEKTNSARLTNSASTMTSFAWASFPPPVVNGKLMHESTNQVMKEGISTTPTDISSPEVLRKQTLASNLSFISERDTMTGFHFSTYADSMDNSSHLPPIVVNLPDFRHSLSSFTFSSNSGSLDISNTEALTVNNSGTEFHTNTELHNAEQHEDNDFYENLLDRINVILSKQRNSDAWEQDTSPFLLTSTSQEDFPDQSSSFNSLLIPRLNYLSAYSTESDNDRSLEFQLLALKYLKKREGVSAFNSVYPPKVTTPSYSLPKTSDTNFSFATQQYLQKYGLLGDNHHLNVRDQLHF